MLSVSIDFINSDIMFSYVSRNREMFHNEVVIKIAKLRIIAQTGKSFEMMILYKFTYSLAAAAAVGLLLIRDN